MEYILNEKQIKNENLIFKLPIKNQNIKYTNYYKLMYSNIYFTLKYLLLQLKFTNYKLIYNYNNYNLVIDKNDRLIEHIKNIELLILNSINNSINKTIVCSLYNDLINKEILYNFSHLPNIDNFCLKISGIWEDKTKIGLVYKFYYNISTVKLSNIIC
tara:strand:+ start:62 stop:535 length:474 start_codon:yes stop_codon:yes gene_type:complete